MPKITDNLLAGMVLMSSFVFAGFCIIYQPAEITKTLPLATTGLATGAAIAQSDNRRDDNNEH